MSAKSKMHLKLIFRKDFISTDFSSFGRLRIEGFTQIRTDAHSRAKWNIKSNHLSIFLFHFISSWTFINCCSCCCCVCIKIRNINWCQFNWSIFIFSNQQSVQLCKIQLISNRIHFFFIIFGVLLFCELHMQIAVNHQACNQ